MLVSFEYSYGKYLSDIAHILKRMDEINREKKDEETKEKYNDILQIGDKMKPLIIKDYVRNKLLVKRDNVTEDINNLFKSKNKRLREEDIIVENNNLLNIRNKDNNSSSSSSSSFPSSLSSSSKRDFSNDNPKFKDELNLDLNQTKLMRNQNMFPLFDNHVKLNVPINNLFVNDLETNFSRNEYPTDWFVQL
jgi:hypothetical protein